MIAHSKARLRKATSVIAPLCLLLLPLGAIARAQEAPESIKIGVLAKRGPERCLEQWGPTAEYLSKQIPGCAFSIIPFGFDEVHLAVERGEVDFVIVNPAIYVGLEHDYAANRIATLKNLHMGEAYTVFAGVIFCKADRKDIERLGDLNGKTFMAVHRQSFGGWYAVWRELKEKGIDPHRDFADLQFGGTHDAVVYAVRDGEVDVGAVRTDTLERMAMEGKIRLDEFRIINERTEDAFPFVNSTPLYPEWPFAEIAGVSGELPEAVAAALLEMPQDSAAAKAARCAGWTVPLNYRSVRECLKELGVGPYKTNGKVTVRAMFDQYWPWLLGAVAVGALLVLLFAIRVWRLNRRLQESMEALRGEIAQRKEARERIEHLNAVLRAIRNVNQLIVKEKGRDRLLQGACDNFVETRGYRSAWIMLLDQSGKLLTTAEAGLGENFLPTLERLERGELTRCGRMALGQSEVVAIEDPLATCGDCPLAGQYGDGGAMTVRLEHEGTVYGLLTVSLPIEMPGDEEEGVLLHEVAGDIAFALHNIETEEERRALEAQLQQSQRLESIGTLAGGVAHEINNPINGIMNYAQLILDGIDPDNPLAEFASEIVHESERVAVIVRNLLTFARQEKQTHSPARMADIVEATLSLIRTVIRRDQITLEVDVPGDLPQVKCRSQQIQQVLMNLMTNARDALNERYPEYDDDKILRVSARAFEKEGARWVRTTVEDHGAGIPPEIRDRLFDPFFTTKGRDQGSGLGLSISYGIVKGHQGELSVESEPGQYTRFHLDLRCDNDWSLDEAEADEG